MLEMGAACVFLDIYFKSSGKKTRIDPDKIYKINSFKWLNFGKGLIKGFGYFSIFWRHYIRIVEISWKHRRQAETGHALPLRNNSNKNSRMHPQSIDLFISQETYMLSYIIILKIRSNIRGLTLPRPGIIG